MRELLLSGMLTFVAVFCFSILFSAPKKERFLCGTCGTLSWFVNAIMTDLGWHFALSIVGATFVLTCLSKMLAVIRKQPAIVYLIPSIFPLVPGSSIYYSAYYFIMGETAQSQQKALETLETAFAIGLGVILAMAVPIFSLLNKGRLLWRDK